MKKLLAMLLALLIVFSMAACGADAGEQESEEKLQLPGTTQETPAAGEETHYKATMKPFEELIPGKRIVILQSCLTFTREGLYTADTAPAPETISFNGADTDAYAVTHLTDLLHEEITADVTVYSADGSSVAVAAEDFLGMFVVIDDFQSGNPATLYNPTTETTVEGFDYAVMANGEGIVSIVTEQERNVMELLGVYGWDTSATYHLIASDLFYIPITPEDYDEGGIRGALSGSINASFPDMTIAMGKMNDVCYIEEIVE